MMIKTVGVVGAGTMGAALAQKFAQEGFSVILADRAMNFVEKGLSNIKGMLLEGAEKKVFSTEQVESALSNLKGTDRLSDLKICDIVIEAIYENFDAKTSLFKELSTIVSDTCILATNTSSYSVTELSASVKNPDRFIGLHFFYHAAKNRLVEIIPGAHTSKKTEVETERFAVLAGKDAITCADAYGFVVNRFFVPWLNEAVRIYGEGIASKEVIDTVCMKTFGIGMGPFALMNATGVPVAYHAEKTLEIFGNLYTTSERLKEQAESGKQWDINNNLQETITPEQEQLINNRMLGVVFYICSQLIDENVCGATEINRGAKIGLKWRFGPIDLMLMNGEEKVKDMITSIASIYKISLPISIGNKYWELKNVKLEIKKDIAIITMDNPENLNALNEITVNQLNTCFDAAEKDAQIKTIYLIGSGKAFVAGADIKFFVKNIKKDKICDIESFTAFGQKVFEKIDSSNKKVVAVINGLALGGGLELALCADYIIALPKAQMAFPETGIGIYPGLGGTQRSVRKIGKGLSKYLIYTGKLLNSTEAKDFGIVDKIISQNDLFELLEGKELVIDENKKVKNEATKSIESFFEKTPLTKILQEEVSLNAEQSVQKAIKTVKQKAPIALKIADKLITEAKGCQSELDHLREIFSTSDALLGLTSIGKKVEYQGK